MTKPYAPDTRAPSARAPIRVFDSGLGGLSVLRAVRDRLPDEALVYVADSRHAPYGPRDDVLIVERNLAKRPMLVATS
ncbi:glutamate racemase, partial [Burkholderia pseudomallei]